ncbi:MAG: diphthine--ammonia ligase [Candidatus Aenigmatarchaeota archaeon]
MKFAGLISGGKDSIYSVYKKISDGWECVCLIAVEGEKDSKMFHVPNIHLTKEIAKLIGKKLIFYKAKNSKDEIKKLEKAILKSKKYGAEAIVCGAHSSNYQRKIIENICEKNQLKLVSPIWNVNPEKYLRNLISSNFKIIFTAVAAEGFNESWLGRELDESAIEDLKNLNKKYSVSLIGEGGEYETFVLKCPIYKKEIKIIKAEKHWEGLSGWLEIKKVKII